MTGTLTNPGIGTLDATDPILRYVDLTTTHIGEAQKLELPAWARPVIPGPGTSPLLYAGTLAGRPAAVLAFEPRRSDLPLQVAFPVLLANLAGELLGGSRTPARRDRPGLAGDAGDPGRRQGRQGGATGRQRRRARWPRPRAPPSVTFARTDLLGVYTVTRDRGPGRHPHPGRHGDAGADGQRHGGTRRVRRRGAGASPTFRPADPDAPVRFAVDLLDVDESRIAPGDAAAIAGLGKPRPRPGPAAPSSTSGPTPATRSGSRSC